jgi:hypothetical protein
VLLVAAAQLAMRHGIRFLPVVPVVFAVHQIPYGVMEILGLLSTLFSRGAPAPPRREDRA